MGEANKQSKVTNYLRKNNYPYVKTTGAGARGWPDICTVINSRFVTIEMKDTGKKPTKKQQKVGVDIILNGGIWVSYDSVENCIALIKHIESLDPIDPINYSDIPESLKGKEVVDVTI